ncbi:MAG: (d)CMP kinase [Verrucomicrobiota bacterium]|jgi:cytidylate kinase
MTQAFCDAALRLPQVVAIDGPSASGKGTLARRLAADFGCTYVDTGAMYRTLAWWTLQSGLRCEKPMRSSEEDAIVRLMRRWDARLRVIDGAAWFTVAGYFPREEIRSDRVERAVPVVAQITRIRVWMVARQRDCAQFGPLVMEGRDIGTEVFPLAQVKFFLEADASVREQRLAQRGNAGSVGSGRDAMDATRRKGALYPALDAIRIDNTHQSPDETYEIMRSHMGRLRVAGAWKA